MKKRFALAFLLSMVCAVAAQAQHRTEHWNIYQPARTYYMGEIVPSLHPMMVMQGGGVINAASCSQADAQTAFNAATSSTTTINIPAGTCTYTTTVSLTVPAGSTTLTVQGATVCTGDGRPGVANLSCVDNTVFIDNLNRSSSDNPMFAFSVGTGFFRVTGMTFETNGSSQQSFNGSITLNGTGTQTRFDHDNFNMPADGKQMKIVGCVYGVIDHIYMTETPGTSENGIAFSQGTCGGDASGTGNGQWNIASGLGTATAMYVEDSYFMGGLLSTAQQLPIADDCDSGGRFVFRFNTFNGVSVQEHATGHAGDNRGCRTYEVYQNSFSGANNTTNPAYDSIFLTSGTGVVWGNSLTGYIYQMISFVNDRATNSTYTQSAPPTGWGYCNNTPTGGVGGPSTWDGNTAGQTGWPCLDGVGWGGGDLLSGLFPTKCNITLNPACNVFTGQYPRQGQEPIYEWGDTGFTPVPGWSNSALIPGGVLDINANRDYYQGTSNAGSPITFTGASGVGSGTRASRPSTCTTGVAYFSTDQGSWNTSGSGGQGVLDKCVGSAWVNGAYVPYTFPHPLDGGVTPPPTTPTGRLPLATIGPLLPAPAAPLVITPTPLPNGTVGTTYNAPVVSTGGTPPIKWSATGLPPGTTIATNTTTTAVINGTLITAGTYSPKVTATDSATPPVVASVTFPALTISAAPTAPVITASAMPTFQLTTPFKMTFTATGCAATVCVWSSTGTIPPGLALASTGNTTAALSGTPTGTAGTSYPGIVIQVN
jgi:hypothetical protein